MQRHTPPEQENSALRAAFERALKRRITDRPEGEVVLPTGTADVTEVAQVLRALDRSHGYLPQPRRLQKRDGERQLELPLAAPSRNSLEPKEV
jgi:hypothetical protein